MSKCRRKSIPCRRSGERQKVYGNPTDVRKKFKCVARDDNNLTLDYASISFDGKNYGKVRPIVEIFDSLTRNKYEGELYVKYPFAVITKPEILRLTREKGDICDEWLNGKPIKFCQSEYDVNFVDSNVTSMIDVGENEYVLKLNFYQRPHVYWALYDEQATESVRNCLWYDTEIENVYLSGSFCVDASRQIVASRAPANINNIQNDGYPNFAGGMTFEAEIYGEEENALLTLKGNCSAVEVFVNGERQGDVCLSENNELLLKKGSVNKITLKLLSSLRNKFGPFHFVNGEDNGVSPPCFTHRGLWKDGKADTFTDEYLLKPYGLDNVLISFEIK